MNQSQHDQFKDRSHMGKPSRLRWLFPFFLIGFHILIAALLLLMRATGMIQVVKNLFPLFVTGCLLSCFSLGILLLIRAMRLLDLTRRQQNFLTLVSVLPVVAGMLAFLPSSEITAIGGVSLGLVYFGGYAGILELINREGFKTHTTENCPFEDNEEFEQTFDENQVLVDEELVAETSELLEENNEALFEALLGQADSIRETIAIDEDRETRSQWMSRTSEPAGVEVIEGGTRVEFSRNQKVCIVHIGISPPLDGKISVACHFEGEIPVRFRVLETRAYGVSVEVKRTQSLETELETHLHYNVSADSLNHEVA